jgi:uncharacterized protein (DUF924 family)
VSHQPWAELIEHWFGDAVNDMDKIAGRMKFWFAKDRERDARLAREFSDLVKEAASGRLYRWLDEPEGRLALVIALDQLPRNLFRGTPSAFAHDATTTAWCLGAVNGELDLRLAPVQRAFLYMPLQHFEDLQIQEYSVLLYTELAKVHPGVSSLRDGFLSYARLHRDIIARFGRFPHRNRVLDRENTPEETEYLAGDAPRFGQ